MIFFPHPAPPLCSPDGAHSDESTPDASQAIYAEFDDDFEDEELTAPIGKCTAMYNFPGASPEFFHRLHIVKKHRVVCEGTSPP